jgi:predicted dienelactone hydrolase
MTSTRFSLPSGLALTALGAAMVAPMAAQSHPFRLPAPTGRFTVGTTALTVSDRSRPSPDGSPRTLKVTVWYPAGGGTEGQRAPYLREQAALEVMASYGRNPAASALLARDVETHARLDAPFAAGRFPALVFSHGYLGMPSDHTALMEDLASHGYAVFSVAHTGETMAVTLPGGRVETLFGPDNRLAPVAAGVLGEWKDEDSVAAAVTGATNPATAESTLCGYLARIPNSTAALERWVADTRAVVDEVTRLAARGSGSPFAERLDLARLGALGHSMGGVTSAAYCARDPRCRGAINLDGSPQYGDLIDHPSPRPFLMVYATRPGRVGVSDLIYRGGASYWRAVLDGTLHLNFGDWQYWDPPARIAQALGPIAAARSTEIVHRLVREFFGQVLDGVRSPLLAGEAVYPELAVSREQ